MQVVLLRVGIDTGSGGIHGPLFKDGSFEYVPISDGFNGCGISDQTYGNTKGKCAKRLLLHYFPESLQQKRRDTPIHYDPEFETFTYGDPTAPKSGLRRLKKGDLLVFYAGLAKRISALGADKNGRPIHVLSPKMQKVFGDFDGHISIQRSPPRWVDERFIAKASAFVTSLR